MNHQPHQQDYLRIQDLALAAVLNLSIPLDSIERINPRDNKVTFVFADSSHIDELVDQFWKRQLTVEPLAYFNSLKFIKSRIHER